MPSICGHPGRKSRSAAKAELYSLFSQLGQDFNGDLFSDDLSAEAWQVKADHLDIINDFIAGRTRNPGSRPFGPTNSALSQSRLSVAIHEHFLKAAGEQEKKESGAFYTPRFLAELVLDVRLQASGSSSRSVPRSGMWLRDFSGRPVQSPSRGMEPQQPDRWV